MASGLVEGWYEMPLPATGPSPISIIAPDSDGHVLIVIGNQVPPRLGLLTGPDRFEPLALPPDFPRINDGYPRNSGVWLALGGGGLALYTASDGVRIMTRQTDIFDIAGDCS